MSRNNLFLLLAGAAVFAAMTSEPSHSGRIPRIDLADLWQTYNEYNSSNAYTGGDIGTDSANSEDTQPIIAEP